MIKKGKWMGLAMALCTTMLVSGCSVGKSTQVKTGKNGEITNDSVVMTVGKKKVRYGEMKDYAYLLNSQYRAGFGETVWNYPITSSKTIGDEGKQEIISMVTQLKVISQAAENQKISLATDEEDEAVQKAEKAFKRATAQDRNKYSLNLQDLEDIYKENILAEKMFYVATDEIGTDVPNEEARQVKIQYFVVKTAGTNRNGQKIVMTDAQKAMAKKSAQKMRTAACKAESFEDYAGLHSDDESCDVLVGKGSKGFDDNVIEQILSLKKSQVSPVLEGKNGYYVVKCIQPNDEDATYARKETIINEKQTALFRKKYGEWLKGKKTNISDTFWEKFSI